MASPVVKDSYWRFKDQKNRFVEALLPAHPDTRLLLNWKNVSFEKPGNWFIMFAPSTWGSFKRGFSGVHYIFAYYCERITRQEFVRLSLGVEKPLKNEFKGQFKMDVVESVRSRRLPLPECDLWPKAGLRGSAKLLETRVPLSTDTAREMLSRYSRLDEFNGLVAEIIERYNDEGKFTELLTFPVQPITPPNR
jgi:hypothetical protein